MPIMKYVWIVLILLLSFPAHADSAYDRVMRTGTVRCGYLPWAPYWDKDVKTGSLRGINKDTFDKVFTLLNLKVEYVEVTLGYQVNDLKNGKVDAICGDGPWIISTAMHVDFGQAYVYQPVYVYVRADNKTLKTESDLDNRAVTFAGIDGDLSSDLKNFRFPNARLNTLINLSDPAALLMEVVSGKADAVIIDSVAAEKIVENNPGKLKRILDGKPLAVYPNAFSVAKGEDRLLRALNEGVAAVLNTGMMDEVLEKWDPHQNLLPIAAPYQAR